MQFVNLIKIGWSQNLETRMQVIPHNEILAVEPGGIVEERARHMQFEHLLVEGQREWFTAAPDLIAHAREIRAYYGDPDRVTGQTKRRK